MLSKKNRFQGYNSLSRTYRLGKTDRGSITALKYLNNRHRKSFRLAVVVAKKVNKSAVVRNRIRRRLFEVVRRHENEINGTYDLILTVFHDKIASMPAADVEEIVMTHFNNAGIINKKQGD